MYQSPEYSDLVRIITRFENIKRHVDMARTLRHMAYAATLTLKSVSETAKSMPTTDYDHEVTIKNHMVREILEHVAQRFENLAAEIPTTPPPEIDIKGACKI